MRWRQRCLPTSSQRGLAKQSIPTPGCFWQRVRNRLKRKDLRFCCAQKSVQETENKGNERTASKEAQFTVRVMDTFASALAFEPSLALLSVKA
jgi:hypothetical protein